MLLADLLAGLFGTIAAAAAVVILVLADTGPFETPSPGAVMVAATLAIIALGLLSLPVLRPRHV